MMNLREQFQRIAAVTGEDEAEHGEILRRWQKHLDLHLRLPCDVTGIEDFRWEEFYIMGPGSAEEHEILRRNRPSYKDTYHLISVTVDGDSEWSISQDDLKAQVERKSDGKRFVLGLSELKSVDNSSPNRQLLHDYSVWFANSP